jgi:hypothetical protein
MYLQRGITTSFFVSCVNKYGIERAIIAGFVIVLIVLGTICMSDLAQE